MKKRKGASTILVLFMVIVLITLGLFTIVSANVNYKLSKKSANWSLTYYELDKECEKNLGIIDKVLLDSEKEAIEQTLNAYTFDAEPTNEVTNVDIYEFLNNKYKYVAMNKLSELAATNNFSTLSVTYDDFDNIDNLEYSMIIKSEVDEDYEIQVQLDIKDILYEINIDDTGLVNGEKVFYEERYDIKKWKQYQNIEVKVNGIEIWDPTESLELDIVSPNGEVGGTWDPIEDIDNIEIVD